MNVVSLLGRMVENGASDLHLVPGAPPSLRINGVITPMLHEVLTPEDTQAIMKQLASKDEQEEVTGAVGVTDFAKRLDQISGGRFRGNIAKTQKGLMIVVRYLPDRIPDMSTLGLPQKVIQDLLTKKGEGGIILVTGPTGSGKSTTLAAMVDWLNTHEACHIVTIEAPVEYEHGHKKAIVNQRQLPIDSPNFAHAVRDSLRQDPDVILIGEMRDIETISAATTAAETGHLVLSTLHTNSAKDTITRIIDSFPINQQAQIRTQLAGSLRAVISQRLLRRSDGHGRVACFEVMINTVAIANNIRENKITQITSAIQTGQKLGMNLFDDHLRLLLQRGVIAQSEALAYAHDPSHVLS